MGTSLPCWRRLALPANRNFSSAPKSINSGGIYPIYAEVDGAVNGRYRCFIVLRPPTERPTSSTNGPGPQAKSSDLHIAVTKLSGLHLVCFLSFIATLILVRINEVKWYKVEGCPAS